MLAQAASAPQNPRMRPTTLPTAFAMLLMLPSPDAGAQGTLYRCESADGISIQGIPCPKGVTQRKIAVQRPIEPSPPASMPAVVSTQAAPKPAAAAPIALAGALRGPSDPYPLWQCMRADGSTFDSRDGVPGRQWVVAADNADNPDGTAAPTPAKITALPKGAIVRPIDEVVVAKDDAPPPDTAAPPPGARPGQWVADQCVRLEAQQACERFATRRDALRKQIYAAKPSERATWAPEEQDLTAMLFAACRR